MKSRQKTRVNIRRIVGRVVSLIEKTQSAREISSCYAGVEALLESRDEIESYVDRQQIKTDE